MGVLFVGGNEDRSEVGRSIGLERGREDDYRPHKWILRFTKWREIQFCARRAGAGGRREEGVGCDMVVFGCEWQG